MDENIFNKLQHLIGFAGKNINVLGEQINIETQLEFFEMSKKLNSVEIKEYDLVNSEKLYDNDVDIVTKKLILTTLAAIEKVESFRIIEKYNENPDIELKDWSLMAYQTSKAQLEGALLNQNQIFISTGLGGKADKLRYFVVVIGKNEQFTLLQQKIIENELNFEISKVNGEVENIIFDRNFAAIKVLFPLMVSIKQLFKKVITESNSFGDFLDNNFLITNVKELSTSEIISFINTNQQKLNETEDETTNPDEFTE